MFFDIKIDKTIYVIPDMSFFKEFIACLAWRPSQAIEALYWYITKRRVRANNRLRRDIYKSPYAYSIWMETFETNALNKFIKTINENKFKYNPKITIIVIDSEFPDEEKNSSIKSVFNQNYDNFELILPENLSFKNENSHKNVKYINSNFMKNAILLAEGDYIFFLKAGDLLSKYAFLYFIAEVQKQKKSIIFSDQDELNKNKSRCNPWFKPKWDRELFLAHDYLTDSCLIDVNLARMAAACDPYWPSSTPYSLLIAATLIAQGSVCHVPYVACHHRVSREKCFSEYNTPEKWYKQRGFETKAAKDRGIFRN